MISLNFCFPIIYSSVFHLLTCLELYEGVGLLHLFNNNLFRCFLQIRASARLCGRCQRKIQMCLAQWFDPLLACGSIPNFFCYLVVRPLTFFFGLERFNCIHAMNTLLSFAHTVVNASHPVRSAKLSTTGPTQYCGGGPRGNRWW